MGEREKLLVKLFKDFRQVQAQKSFYNHDRRNVALAVPSLPLMLRAFPVLLFTSSE